MYIRKLIDSIDIICQQYNTTLELYMKLRNILDIIDYNEFNSDLKNFNYENIIEIKNSNDVYTKYVLKSSETFDLVLIKWNKNSFTKIHDHPDKGCLLKVLSGTLVEELYENNLKYFSFEKMNLLTKNNIGYKIGKKILHKIKAMQNSESLHIYLPGNYTSKNY